MGVQPAGVSGGGICLSSGMSPIHHLCPHPAGNPGLHIDGGPLRDEVVVGAVLIDLCGIRVRAGLSKEDLTGEVWTRRRKYAQSE